jgi:hypothetical protein
MKLKLYNSNKTKCQGWKFQCHIKLVREFRVVPTWHLCGSYVTLDWCEKLNLIYCGACVDNSSSTSWIHKCSIKQTSCNFFKDTHDINLQLFVIRNGLLCNLKNINM